MTLAVLVSLNALNVGAAFAGSARSPTSGEAAGNVWTTRYEGKRQGAAELVVVIAAVLVAWTATPWPDLITAFVIASLFLQSSWSIIRDARAELTTAAGFTQRV